MSTPESTIPLSTYSLQDLKSFNHAVYGPVNGRNFELWEMLGRLAEYNSRVLLRVRRNDTKRTPYHLCMMLSWLLAIANRLYVDLHKEVTEWCATGLSSDVPLFELQTFFVSKLSSADLKDTGLCLAEKVLALTAAIGKFGGVHEENHLKCASKKMAETIEALCVISSLLGVPLAKEFEKHFSSGCNKCRKIPCDCGFRVDTVV